MRSSVASFPLCRSLCRRSCQRLSRSDKRRAPLAPSRLAPFSPPLARRFLQRTSRLPRFLPSQHTAIPAAPASHRSPLSLQKAFLAANASAGKDKRPGLSDIAPPASAIRADDLVSLNQHKRDRRTIEELEKEIEERKKRKQQQEGGGGGGGAEAATGGADAGGAGADGGEEGEEGGGGVPAAC